MEEFQVCDRDLDDAVLSQYLNAEAIAVDTETMGLLPQRDHLCENPYRHLRVVVPGL